MRILRLLPAALAASALAACAATTAPPAGRRLALADGVEMAYLDSGSGEPALVFVHCGTCRKEIWTESLAAFAPHHRVVAMDLPGHGLSGPRRTGPTLEGFGADVARLVDHLKLRQVVLIGNSLGGPVSLEAARRLGPGRVLGVVAVDTLQNVEAEWPEADFRRRVDAFRADFPGTCAAMMQGLLPKDAPAATRERIGRDTCGGDPETFLALFETLRTYDDAAALAAAGVPVAAINSTVFPTAVEANRRHAPSFEVVLMEGVGHFPQVERPVEFEQHLAAIVESWLGAPASAPQR